ncbi:hypothetical protein FDG2_5454 [Candidatus Protofrankia californiensis]|uniref:Uncharacterized protein n=1 Tax=Candidatus Protofrankia californiensis TaxID=1839754 RepID=A0A1C3PDF7_9ACTN|nr:hypothetical protein FDG2_5454 [Candidatus Protofrankia californiensis]
MAFVLVDVDTCRACAGWGRVRADRLCFACWSWSQRIKRPAGPCRRCGCTLLLNDDRMCRLCVLEVRYHDEEWLLAEAEQRPTPRRGLQVSLLLDGVRLASAQPLSKRGTPRVGWWRAAHPIAPRHTDLATVCPPQITGQLALFRLPRTLTLDHAAIVEHRVVPDLALVEVVLDRRCAATPMSPPVRGRAVLLARLALVARDADSPFVGEEDLDALPRDRALTAALLRDAGLLRARLRPAVSRRPAPAPPRPAGSCAHCLAWDAAAPRVCARCASFARRSDGHFGACDRCARHLPLVNALCRFCHVIMMDAPVGGPPAGQLWFGGRLGLDTPHVLRRLDDPHRREIAVRRAGRARRAQPTPAVSEYLTDPRQSELFPTGRRDWAGIERRPLPALTAAAQGFVDAFDQQAREQSWKGPCRTTNLRVLTILVAWLGADAPIQETDVRAVAVLRTNLAGLRVAQFLDAHHLLIPDPAKQVSMDEAAVHRLADAMSDVFRGEVHIWIGVLRGEGTRPSRRMSWTTIRRYLGYVLPVLRAWRDDGIDSLNQITSEHVTAAIAAQPYPGSAHSGLRSLFRALKREQRIFRDPAGVVHLVKATSLPRPLPTDRIQGLIDRAPTSMSAAAIALIAIHGIHHQQLMRLRLDDLDRARGRLLVHRPGTTRTTPSVRIVFLHDLTLRLLTAWLHDRHHRWPHSTNPHLFVSLRTAMNTDGPPINKFCLMAQLRKVGVTPSQLWTDRVLDEAASTADPVQLMRVFDISKATAVKYVATAHPERFAPDPTHA